MQKQYITAEELQTIMGISRGKAYEIIRSCNQELKAQGFITDRDHAHQGKARFAAVGAG